MTTSQIDTILSDPILSEPIGSAPIDLSTRLYFAGLARHYAHELLLEAFVRSNLSKADLAARLSYDPSRVGRILNTPANITLETFGEMLFAIDGSCARFSQQWPLREEPHNYDGPDWLSPGGGGAVSYLLFDVSPRAAPSTAGSSTSSVQFVPEPA